MAQATDIFELGALGLGAGEGRRLDLLVEVGSFLLAGERYRTVPDRRPVRLDVARTGSGWSLRIRFDASLSGPCMRCLEEAAASEGVDAREVHQEASEDPELTSPYVGGDVLDVGSWARDALSLALPEQVVCREECLGLCGICGEDLNLSPEHEHERAPDPRWAKLSELRFE